MADLLADAFRAEIPCDGPTASLLAARARERLPRLAKSPEDTDEDLVLRLRDPRLFGAFVEGLLGEPEVSGEVRRALVEHVFDLLPLPRTEGEVFEVEARAPPHLLALATVLAETDGLTVLHAMHLVYAVFLDRSLVRSVGRTERSQVLQAILARSEAEEGLRLFYAALHLSAVPEREAASEIERVLRSNAIPAPLRRRVASLAVAEDGGRAELARLAQKEGLLPSDIEDLQSPEILANVPRLPSGLAKPARTYLARAEPS